MDIGKQYQPDDDFKAKARLFQSQYRANVLKVAFQDYGNRLTDADAMALLNYYDQLNSREVLRQRYPSYSKSRDADLLRSEHIPFNLLAPLATNRDAAIEIIAEAWDIHCTEIQRIEIEYAPSPKKAYLNDGTAFDTYLKVKMNDESTCGIGIEVKYTEQAYPIGKTERLNVANPDSLYWQTARASGVFQNPDDKIFGKDALRQVWRNHLLGLKMVATGDVDEFYAITLFPDGNSHFHHTIAEYKSKLQRDAQPYVIGCTFEKYISAIHGSEEFEAWKSWLERRYIVEAT